MEHKWFEFKVDEIKEGAFAGYGAVFDTVDQGGDLIEKTAFNKSLESGRRPKMLWQHNPTDVIGVWDSVKVDDRGLAVKGRILPDVSRGKEVLTLLREKAVDGLSIGYKTIDYEIDGKGADRVRRLKEVSLWEISVVTFPMNTEATVTDVKQLQSPRDVERLLKDAGVPGQFAKLVALHGFEEATKRLSGHRDGDDEARVQASLKRLLSEVQGLKEIINA